MTAPSRQELIGLIREADPYTSSLSVEAVADAILARIGGGWRTMESAPKDESPILMIDADGAVFGGYWDRDCGCWAVHCGQPVVQSPEPTHWMPLPSPPGGGE